MEISKCESDEAKVLAIVIEREEEGVEVQLE